MSSLTENLQTIYQTKLEIKEVLGTASDVFTEYPGLIQEAIAGGGGELEINRVGAFIEEKDWNNNQINTNISYSTENDVTTYEFDLVNGVSSHLPTLYAYISVGSYEMRESLVVNNTDQIVLRDAGTSYSTSAYIFGVEYEPDEYAMGGNVVSTQMPGHYEIAIANNGTYATVSGTMANKLAPDSIVFYTTSNYGGNGTYYSALMLDSDHGFGPEDTGYGKYRISVNVENNPTSNNLNLNAYVTVLGYATNLRKPSSSSANMQLNSSASNMTFRYTAAEGYTTYDIYVDPEFVWNSNNIILSATAELTNVIHGDTKNIYATA